MTEDETAKPSQIYHICRRIDWEAGLDGDLYHAPDSDRADGFLHFSTGAQIVESAARHRAGQAGLVLIELDIGKLGPGKLGPASDNDLRWEPSRNGALFPHLYGPIPLAAVTAVTDLPLGPDGLHVFSETG